MKAHVVVLAGLLLATLALAADPARAQDWGGLALQGGASSHGSLFGGAAGGGGVSTGGGFSSLDGSGVDEPVATATATATALGGASAARPVARKSSAAASKAAKAKAAASAAFIEMLTDADNARITSGYGGRSNPQGMGRNWHSGVDVGAMMGASIFAAAAGTVTIATYDQGCGFMVELEHKTGYRTRYCHAAGLLVDVGMDVEAGAAIAIVGSTGESTGAHVHFEVRRKSGATVNPHKAIREHLLDRAPAAAVATKKAKSR